MKHIMPKFKKKLFQSVNKMKIYIYESPDNGKTIFRREFGDYETPREKMQTVISQN